MSILNPSETLWCERTQDMSGFVLPDLTSPPLDEQFNFTFSTAQHENDFDMQNPGNIFPEEVILEDQADSVFDEDSDMFDNSNYSALNTELKTWLPSISEIDEFVNSTAFERRDFLPPSDSENSLLLVGSVKDDKKLSTSKKPNNLSIFECEEPYIKEDPDTLSYSCTDSKLIYRDEMEVAAEEEVVTCENPKLLVSETKSSFAMNSWLHSPELYDPVVPKSEAIERSNLFTEELSSPLRNLTTSEDPLICENHQDMFRAEEMDWMFPEPVSSFSSLLGTTPKLRLDIGIAKMQNNQFFGEPLPDTPEVLKPVLKPEDDFDLVNFLLATGDSNNNATTPSSSCQASKPKPSQEQRRGKSHLSLQELKSRHGSRKRSLPETEVEDVKPTPAPFSFCDRLVADPTSNLSSSPLSSTGRPRRESATRFNKRLEEGLLSSIMDSNSVSSDDEDSRKSKRRRTVSSSRKRLNSDSDQSSICDGVSKYRERRDRNNVSSKKSRQKRKEALQMKTYELKDLEEQNRKLTKKANELAAVLEKVHKSWKEYLSTVKN